MVQRVAVVGSSGAGKTTVSIQIARTLGCVHTELDGLFHQAGWTRLPPEDFRAEVGEIVAGETWVVDGNYSEVQPLVLARADTVVWLDLPRLAVMGQLVPRTLGRMLSRKPLWNGNTEKLSNLLRLDPEENVLLWAWTQHARVRRRYADLAANPGPLDVVRLGSRTEVRRFLDGIRH